MTKVYTIGVRDKIAYTLNLKLYFEHKDTAENMLITFKERMPTSEDQEWLLQEIEIMDDMDALKLREELFN